MFDIIFAKRLKYITCRNERFRRIIFLLNILYYEKLFAGKARAKTKRDGPSEVGAGAGAGADIRKAAIDRSVQCRAGRRRYRSRARASRHAAPLPRETPPEGPPGEPPRGLRPGAPASSPFDQQERRKSRLLRVRKLLRISKQDTLLRPRYPPQRNISRTGLQKCRRRALRHVQERGDRTPADRKVPLRPQDDGDQEERPQAEGGHGQPARGPRQVRLRGRLAGDAEAGQGDLQGDRLAEHRPHNEGVQEPVRRARLPGLRQGRRGDVLDGQVEPRRQGGQLHPAAGEDEPGLLGHQRLHDRRPAVLDRRRRRAVHPAVVQQAAHLRDGARDPRLGPRPLLRGDGAQRQELQRARPRHQHEAAQPDDQRRLDPHLRAAQDARQARDDPGGEVRLRDGLLQEDGRERDPQLQQRDVPVREGGRRPQLRARLLHEGAQVLPGEDQPARVHGLLLPVLRDGGDLRRRVGDRGDPRERGHLPDHRREDPAGGVRAERPLADAQLRHVRLFGTVRLQSRPARQVRGVRGDAHRRPERDGDLRLVAVARPPRQQLQGAAVLRGAGGPVQLPQVRQPAVRDQQEEPEAAQVRDDRPEHRQPALLRGERRPQRPQEAPALRHGHDPLRLRRQDGPAPGGGRGPPRLRRVPPRALRRARRPARPLGQHPPQRGGDLRPRRRRRLPPELGRAAPARGGRPADRGVRRRHHQDQRPGVRRPRAGPLREELRSRESPLRKDRRPKGGRERPDRRLTAFPSRLGPSSRSDGGEAPSRRSLFSIPSASVDSRTRPAVRGRARVSRIKKKSF